MNRTREYDYLPLGMHAHGCTGEAEKSFIAGSQTLELDGAKNDLIDGTDCALECS